MSARYPKSQSISALVSNFDTNNRTHTISRHRLDPAHLHQYIHSTRSILALYLIPERHTLSTMCRYLNTEIYCEGHGYLPVEKPQHELYPADERVLVKRLVLSRRSVLICELGNCFSYPDLKYEYEQPRYDVYLRFREGRCLSCIYKEAERMLRGTFSQTYHEVTLEHLPPTGQPLSPHIHDKASMGMWNEQRSYIDGYFRLPEMAIRPEDSLIEDVKQITDRLQTRPQGLSDVFVIEDDTITLNGTEEERKRAERRAQREAQRRAPRGARRR